MHYRWSGNPMDNAAAIESAERRERELLADTGCYNCVHAITAWDQTVCDIGQTHPKCVFRKKYLRVVE